MLRCIFECDNPYEASKGINDLALIRTPTASTSVEFYQEWRTTMIEVEGVVREQELKAILEQKMENSGLFNHELKTIDMWDLDDEEMYHRYTTIIEENREKTAPEISLKIDSSLTHPRLQT